MCRKPIWHERTQSWYTRDAKVCKYQNEDWEICDEVFDGGRAKMHSIRIAYKHILLIDG